MIPFNPSETKAAARGATPAAVIISGSAHEGKSSSTSRPSRLAGAEDAAPARRGEGGATVSDGAEAQADLLEPDVEAPSGSRGVAAEERFDWSTDESVIIAEQPETALYWNNQHQLVVRQRRWPDDDAFVYFNRAHLAHLIAMLKAEAES